MFRADAQESYKHGPDFGNVNSINEEVISEIEKELHDNQYDMISLVFLLYDVPDTALQRLIIYQRVSRDTNLNLLNEWYRYANSQNTWREQFVEVLVICQLYSIVKKLGYDVSNMKKKFQPDNINVAFFVNPMRKALYKLCENINSENLSKIKKTLLTFDINTEEYESCEMVFLQLMCQKFITLNQNHYDKKVVRCDYNIEKLASVLENISGLNNFGLELRSLQKQICDDKKSELNTSLPITKTPADTPQTSPNVTDEKIYESNMDEIFEMINQLALDDINDPHLKSDTRSLDKDCYRIKNTSRVGLCLIINQEDFYPSKDSIESNQEPFVLDRRLGSACDKIALEKTMTALNFKVISKSNLDHIKMIEFIKNSIQNEVIPEDSIFILCILSHGVRDHVYAADSVKVKVEDIQNVLDSNWASCLRDMPKILIIQACQVDDVSRPVLVADSHSLKYHMRKTDFLVYWATVPEFKAWRQEQKGSIFIQILCGCIKQWGHKEHLYDIFTKVNKCVTDVCKIKKCVQVPRFDSTLTKKLFLQVPT